MEASAGLVAGSHNRNELVVIRREGESGVSNSISALLLLLLFLFFFIFILGGRDLSVLSCLDNSWRLDL